MWTTIPGALARTGFVVLTGLLSTQCVSTELSVPSDHPASAQARPGRWTKTSGFGPDLRSNDAPTPSADPHSSHAPAAAPRDGEGHEHGEVRYTCPMHPEVVRTEPGTCPKCGMKLVPEKGGQ